MDITSIIQRIGKYIAILSYEVKEEHHFRKEVMKGQKDQENKKGFRRRNSLKGGRVVTTQNLERLTFSQMLTKKGNLVIYKKNMGI